MDSVRATFDANTYGAPRVAQVAFPHMVTRRSELIVNIHSVVADTPYHSGTDSTPPAKPQCAR
ncbi:hypothetical protein B0H19DRAFT_1264933 [Mycena capillaripes]|nr:hypothetical protein B0H19DRAFT_1264933 [Mycena capillaripes]